MDKQIKKEPLLEAVHLKKYFNLPRKKKLHAVDDVSFTVYEGETLGLVGESGCGKSTVGNVVMRLLPQTDGKLLFRGTDIFSLSKKEQREYCRKMQIIFQDPYSSLNPRKTVRAILREPFEIHASDYFAGQDLDEKVLALCDSVSIPRNLLDHYPSWTAVCGRSSALPVHCHWSRNSLSATSRFLLWTFRFRRGSSTCSST